MKRNAGIAGCRSRGAFASLGVLFVEGNAQVKRAEAEVLDILQSAQGRGKDGLSSEQQEALAAAIYVLEEDGGLKVVYVNSRARLVLLLRLVTGFRNCYIYRADRLTVSTVV
jgi:hypothetical protein